MELLRPADAARELGVSYPTLKQWIYTGKVTSVRTPGGHHRISRSEIDRLTQVSASLPEAKRSGARSVRGARISGRNKLRGKITEVRYEGLLAQVLMDIGSQTVTAIITRSAAEEMGLRRGLSAAALIKATEVMIIRE